MTFHASKKRGLTTSVIEEELIEIDTVYEPLTVYAAFTTALSANEKAIGAGGSQAVMCSQNCFL